jgi:lysophospholipase L1-like esterase
MTNAERLFVLVAIATIATACGNGDTVERARSPEGGSKLSGKYVAMGSSFAAGPGVPDLLPDQACGRSSHNYAHLAAAALGLELTDVSCAGATIDNIVSTPQNAEPLQLAALTADTKLVTITIGGNDVTYGATLVACALAGADGRSCLTAAADAGAPDVDRAAIDALLAGEESELVSMLEAVKSAAPEALVYLLAYPRMLPEPPAPCPPYVQIQPADGDYAADLGARLEAAFVAAAHAAGVHFLDVYAESRGHDACASPDQRWVEGQATPASAPYHPNAAGMRAQAELLVTALTR